MATEALQIRVTEDGSRQVKANLEGISQAGQKSVSSVDLLKRALASLGGALALKSAVQQFVELSNEATRLDNRLKTVTNSAQQLESVNRQLLSTANETRTAFASTVELYTRTATAAKELGRSEQELLRFTNLLAKETRLSGASSAEAKNALIQLSQGIASGTLRGDELRSVLEQLPTVADRIAESLGVTRGQLRKLGEEGKITGQAVVDAFLKAGDTIDERFKKAVSSPADAFQVLQNNLLQFVRGVNQSTGASDALARGILSVANNVEVLIPLLTSLAAIATFNVLISQASTFFSTIGSGIAVVRQLTTSLLAMRTAQTAVVATDFFSATAAMAARGASSGAIVTAGSVVGGGSLLAIGQLAAAAGAFWLTLKGIEATAEAVADSGFFSGRGVQPIKEMTGETYKLGDALSLGNRNAEELLSKLRPGNASQNTVLKDFKDQAELMLLLDAGLKTRLDKEAGFNLTNAEAVAVMAERLKQLTPIKLLDSEKEGTEAQQLATKIGLINDRIKQLNNATEEGRVSLKDYNQAIGVQAEKLDKLTGGVGAELREVEARIKFFSQAGGDMRLADSLAAGASTGLVSKLIERRSVLEQLTRQQQESTRAVEDARRADEQRRQSIASMLEQLREQNRQLGMTDQQRSLRNFQNLGADDNQVNLFEQQQQVLASRQTEMAAQSQIQALQQKVIEFNQAAERLRQATENSPKKIQDEAAKIIQDGTVTLKQAAEQLGKDLGSEIGPAAKPLVEQAGSEMVRLADQFGVQMATALSNAFAANLRLAGAAGAAAVPQLGPGGPSSLGPAGGFPATGTFSSPQTQQFLQETQRATNSINELNTAVETFGPTAGRSFESASRAAGGFGGMTQNIGNQFNNFGSMFQNVFSGLENALVSFVTTGKLDFKQLINSILADLARMVIQMMIIRPLMGFFGGMFGGFFGFSGGGLVPGFAAGGAVRGPGTSTSDSILARLSHGEFVVNAAATSQYLPLLRAINDGGALMPAGWRLPQFAAGGIVGGFDAFDRTMLPMDAKSSGYSDQSARMTQMIAQQVRDISSRNRTTASSGGSPIVMNSTINVSVTSRGDAQEDGAAIAKQIDVQIKSRFAEMLRNEQRPGGMLAGSGR